MSILMGLSVTAIIWYVLIYILTASGNIRHYPGIYNKGLPFYYLIAPCFYLFIKGALDSKFSVFRKIDLLHLLIVIPGCLSILPYNFLSAAEQQEVVNHLVADTNFAFTDTKYIVGTWHLFTFPISAFVYTFIQFLYVLKKRKEYGNTPTIKWIYLFTAICGFVFLATLAVNFTIFQNLGKSLTVINSNKTIYISCFGLLVLSMLFFTNPQLLFDLIPQSKIAEQGGGVTLLKKMKSPPEESKAKPVNTNLAAQVEAFITETQIYKTTGLTLNEFASLVEIPTYKLSELFNNYYKLNFNTYINNLRVNYIKNRLDNGDGKLFTLEAIANEAGFSSRNTFFVAFKKAMNVTPSAYISMLKDK